MSRLESCRTAPGQAFARTLSKISAAAHSGRARSRRTFNRNNVRSWKWSTATMLEMTDCNWASAILYNSVACTNAKCVWKNSHDHGNVKSLHLRCRWMRVRAVGGVRGVSTVLWGTFENQRQRYRAEAILRGKACRDESKVCSFPAGKWVTGL